MKNLFIFVACLFLFVMPMISALVTELEIQAEPDENYIMTVSDYQTGEPVERWSGLVADEDGKISQSFQSELIVLRIKIMSIKNQKVFETKEFGPYPAGEVIEIDFNEGVSSQITNADETDETEEVSAENTTEEVVEENETIAGAVADAPEEITEGESSKSVTGLAIGNITDIFGKIKYYVYGIALVAVMVIIAFFILSRSKKTALENNTPPVVISRIDSLLDVEKKLRDVQDEIKSLEEGQ